jgi:hypothetical protein
MFETCSEEMGKKISEANVQQAFVLDEILKRSSRNESILCVGCFEDTAFCNLQWLEYGILMGIDPNSVYPLQRQSLEEFYSNAQEKYNVVFATSVLEHVQDDETFLSYFCDLIAPGGVGILTCDFNHNYKPGDPVPATVVRQYTPYDLGVRLKEVLDRYNCRYVDEPDWTGELDFHYQGHDYAFATMVFVKES